MVNDGFVTATQIAQAVGGKRSRTENILRTPDDVKVVGVVGITKMS